MITTEQTPNGIDDATLLSFLRGDLDVAESLFIATHCHLSADAKSRAAMLNTCAATALEEIAPVPMRCCPIKFFETRCCTKQQMLPIAQEDTTIPKPLRSFVPQGFSAIAWKNLLPGIKEKRLCLKGTKHTIKLLSIAKGTHVPMHSHAGEEMTLVLQGSFIDDSIRYCAGDVSIHSKHDAVESHSPFADQDCICLVLFKDGGIRLPGIIGRLISPFL